MAVGQNQGIRFEINLIRFGMVWDSRLPLTVYSIVQSCSISYFRFVAKFGHFLSACQMNRAACRTSVDLIVKLQQVQTVLRCRLHISPKPAWAPTEHTTEPSLSEKKLRPIQGRSPHFRENRHTHTHTLFASLASVNRGSVPHRLRAEAVETGAARARAGAAQVHFSKGSPRHEPLARRERTVRRESGRGDGGGSNQVGAVLHQTAADDLLLQWGCLTAVTDQGWNLDELSTKEKDN